MCQAAVEGSLGRVPGVMKYEVTLNTDTAVVTYDANKVTPDQIVKAVADSGYKPKEVEELK